MRPFIKAIFGNSKEAECLEKRLLEANEVISDLREDLDDLRQGDVVSEAKLELAKMKLKERALELSMGVKRESVSELLENADKILKWLKQ